MGICGVNARGKCYTERNMNCKEGCPSGWHVMKTFAHGCCRSWTDCGGNKNRCRKEIPCEGPCVERKKMNCKQGCESGWTHIATENYGCCSSFGNCGGNMKVCQREICNCQDTQAVWKDQDGDDCAKYEKMGWCGASWQHKYKDPSGLTADQGCCACQDRRRLAPMLSGSDKPSAKPQPDASRLAGVSRRRASHCRVKVLLQREWQFSESYRSPRADQRRRGATYFEVSSRSTSARRIES